MNNKPIIGIVSKPNIFCDNELFTQQIIYDGVRNAINEEAMICPYCSKKIKYGQKKYEF